ncbi:F-box/FBD/LRR-repeat protein [Trifolium repens]|nr:F-box/FBD/LRR-repeat protein [Trifolium repens]
MSNTVDEMMIQPATKKVKFGESENEDRLSDLPEYVILHIISLRIFNKFVSRVLSHRDSSITLQSLDFRHDGCIDHRLLKRIVNYVSSHNVQRLGHENIQLLKRDCLKWRVGGAYRRNCELSGEDELESQLVSLGNSRLFSLNSKAFTGLTSQSISEVLIQMSNSADETMVQPTAKRPKHGETENADRLSDLPDCVILHILSFLNTRQAVQTCVLSPRYRDLWKHLPTLILQHKNFGTIKIFTKFLSRVLSLRDDSIPLLSLHFSQNGCLQPHLIKRVANYAISHNVQRLGLSVICNIEQLPPSIFSCQSITYLELSVYPKDYGPKPVFPKSFSLPALTTLHLGNFAFCPNDNNSRAEPFSAFNRLNTLVLLQCGVRDTLNLCISSATLVKFTMHSHSYDFYEIELCTPSLDTFAFIGRPHQKISGSSLSYVKHVDIDAEISSMDTEIPPKFLLSWLLELINTKSLTVTASTLQVLSLNSNLLKIKLPSLGNLKSLKVKTKPLTYGFRKTLNAIKLEKIKSRKEAAKLRKSFKAGLEPSAPIPEGIENFLIQNSPLAEVKIIDCS